MMLSWRMRGEFVMREHEVLRRRPTPQSVGMGSYTMDFHNLQRYKLSTRLTPTTASGSRSDAKCVTRNLRARSGKGLDRVTL